MTDKQTIINGVDVSWCDFYSMDGGCASESYYCKDDNRCYYKQLKRKGQECRLLKAALKDKNLVALVEENEKLKQKVQDNETFYLKKYANKDSECLELQHKVNVLKQALERIKQIVNQDIAFIGYSDEFNDLIINEIKEAFNEN